VASEKARGADDADSRQDLEELSGEGLRTVPRVKPKTPRFAPDEIVRAWQAFSADYEGLPYTVPRGTRLRGDHPAVVAAPWNFVRADEPDDHDPTLFAAYEEPARRFTSPTRIRFVPRHTNASVVLIGARTYRVGEEVTVPAATAEVLVSDGYAVPA
jgi:hypothetical protein